MPNYTVAFPIINAYLEQGLPSFNIGEVTFSRISELEGAVNELTSCLIKDKVNSLFVYTETIGSREYAIEESFQKCSLAVDIFKICSDLYHSNYYNPKKWLFDIDSSFIANQMHYSFHKENEVVDGKFYFSWKADKFPTHLYKSHIDSLKKWNIDIFEGFYTDYFSSKRNNFYKVIRRAIHTYSRSFSLPTDHERLISLCTVLETLVTNEREGKVSQTCQAVAKILNFEAREKDSFESFYKNMYNIRSEYIHNAEENEIKENELNYLERVVFYVIREFVKNRNDYKSCKEYTTSILKS